MKRPIDDVNKRVSGGGPVLLLPNEGTHATCVYANDEWSGIFWFFRWNVVGNFRKTVIVFEECGELVVRC